MALLRYKNKQGQTKPFTSIIVKEAEDIEVDEDLSEISENPVQNKVITKTVNNKIGKNDLRAITNLELEDLLK